MGDRGGDETQGTKQGGFCCCGVAPTSNSKAKLRSTEHHREIAQQESVTHSPWTYLMMKVKEKRSFSSKATMVNKSKRTNLNTASVFFQR